MKNFNEMNLPSEIISSLENMNIKSPTEIQAKTIPVAMSGLDILASSQTGSGKTLAYLLPLICSLIQNGGRALILVPTRELAAQIQNILIKVTHKLKMPSVVLIGGDSMPKQLSELKFSPKIIIATPGRMIDHLLRGSLKLDKVNLLVLDEMDRMLDMGMREQLEEINKHMPETRQVLMFSATMPKHIIDLSKKYLNNPERIAVGSTTQAAPEIEQEVLYLSSKEKFGELIKQLGERGGSVIVFVKTKRGADQLAKMLKAENHKADSLHGDLNQRRRERVIASFRKGYHRVMVATDIAARGLDTDTQVVINYDIPMCPEDYLHRIGRTGRAGAKGVALSFVAPDEHFRWKAIDRLLTKGETTSKKELLNTSKRSKRPFNKNGRRQEGASFFDKKRFNNKKRA